MEFEDKESLIKIFPFKIIEANYFSRVLRDSNKVAGPGHSSWITGVIPYANFKVEGDTIKEIKEIEFYGNISGIHKGDKIAAYLNLYKETSKSFECPGCVSTGGTDFKTVYLEREPESKEVVSKIEQIGFDGKVVATFHGLEDYTLK